MLTSLIVGVALAFVAAAPAAVEAQQASGYWLYVDGVWKGGFMRREECDAAATRTAGKAYECRAVIVGGGSSASPTIREPSSGGAVLGAKGPNDQWDSDVKACSRTTGVEAVVSGPGRVEYFGPPRERFEFTKCMVKRGHQLQ